MTLFGAYLGNGSATNPIAKVVDSYEAWLGRPLGVVALHTGAQNWSDWSGSIGWQVYNHREVINTHDLHWSIPLIPNTGASMKDAALGNYSAKYLKAAQTIAAGTPGDGAIYIRTGWEFNATWSPVSSSAMGQPESYIGAFRNFVDTFRSVSDRFVFEWTPNIGNHGMNPADAYPGDKYVDIIGMDFYWDSKASWGIKDPAQAWNYFVNQQYGLQWLENFAAAHGKPTAYSEWGINADNAKYYIDQVAKWFADHNVVYANYWESNAAFTGKLSDGQYPASAEEFIKMFGGPLEAVLPIPQKPQETGAVETWSHIGTAGNDVITGDARNNHIHGRGGADTMAGAKGDDTYVVTSGFEALVEKAAEGIDKVVSYAKNFTLADNIENLTLAATYTQNGTGNALDNIITGNAYENTIAGKAGNDYITLGGGKDILVFAKGDGHDVVTDFAAADIIKIEGFAYTSFAGLALHLHQAGSNVTLMLDGANAISFLNKKLADFTAANFTFDTMAGTSGADTYTVVSGKEVITEQASGGIDTVDNYAVQYTLADNIENMNLLIGPWLQQYATANALDNVITGGAGENIVHGMAGNDRIYGGAGKDFLYGDAGNDLLAGGSGNDLFFGGTGADTFLFAATDLGTIDRIKDFSLAGHDRIDISGLLDGTGATQAAIDHFVRLAGTGAEKTLEVDVTGQGSAFRAVAIIENASALTGVAELLQQNALVI